MPGMVAHFVRVSHGREPQGELLRAAVPRPVCHALKGIEKGCQ